MNEDQREQQLHDLAAPYALDALDPAERAAFETHLQTCPGCRAEVDDLREAAVGLSEGLEVVPSADLRRRVLEQVAAEAARVPGTTGQHHLAEVSALPRPDPAGGARPADRRGRRGWWLAAAAAVVIGAGSWGATQLVGQDDPALRIVQAQDAREYEAQTPEGELIVIASAEEGGAVLRVPADLAAPPQGRVYQAWFVGVDGSARSAGLLTAESLESRDTVLEGALEGAAAVGLTVEPEGGSQQPTTEPFAVVPLG